MMFEISISVTIKSLPKWLNKNFITKILVRLPKKYFKKSPKIFSFVFIGDHKMKKLNYTYRGKNYSTDVLSFRYERIGEILICVPQAVHQAYIFNIPLKKEMARLIAHGILHTVGFDHERSEKEAKKMFTLQDKMAGWDSAPF